MPTVRVVTFNVRNSRGRDGFNHWLFRRRAALRAIDPSTSDVIALQEARLNQFLYFRLRLWRFRAYSRARDDGRWRGEQCPLFIRRSRFVLRARSTRWLSDTPDVPGSRHWGNAFPRIATVIEVEDRTSHKLFGILNTHLDEKSEPVRTKSTQLIVDLTRSSVISDWIMLGDFNATPVAPSMRGVFSAGFNDALAHLPADGPGGATSHDFTGRTAGSRIDHILVTPQWRVIDAAIVRPAGRMASDHWPVHATLEHT